MKLEIVPSKQFRKDVRLAIKRGKNLTALDIVVTCLTAMNPLPQKYRDHSLTGRYIGFRECHIEPDWLSIYRIEDEKLLLILFRTGSHSDLFK